MKNVLTLSFEKEKTQENIIDTKRMANVHYAKHI